MGVKAHEWLTGRDRVAIFDDPLDDSAAVRRGDLDGVAQIAYAANLR